MHKPSAKLWTFKGFVFLQFVQLVIFGLLNGQAFTPTAYITYDDLYYGIPAAITCIEAWVFTGLFMWSFSTKEYLLDSQSNQGSRMPFSSAIFNCFNISDIVAGIVLMFDLLMEGRWQPGRSGGRMENAGKDYRMENMQPQDQSRRHHGHSGHR